MIFLPAWLTAVIAFTFGAIIGSFANVVIYRMHTGRSLNDRSHCLSCGTQLRWYELVPLISYVALLGRCRTCGCWIPVRYLTVELAVALSFVLIAFTVNEPTIAALLAVLCVVLVIGATYDLYHLIIPDEVVWGSAVVAGTLLLYEAYRAHHLWIVADGVLGGIGAFLVYAGLWYVSAGRWIGFGDAKLAIPLGMLTGIAGIFSLIVLSFWVGAATSLIVIGVQALTSARRVPAYPNGGIENQARYLTMKSEVPFAPFLIAAFYLVMFFRADVLALTAYVLA